jgi:hypothetical protein
MKKLITILLLLAAGSSFAQNLNGGMETWQNYVVGLFPPTQLEKPAGWRCPDSLICALGPLIVPGGSFGKQLYKTTDRHGGSFAARLKTRDQDTLGVVPGIMTNAQILVDISNQSYSFSGGAAIGARVDTVKAWVKYLPKNGDTAAMVVSAVIKGAGANGDDSIVGGGIVMISGSGSYYEIAAAVDYIDAVTQPDAIQVTFFSSFDVPQDSSELYVDDVSAVGPAGISYLYTGEDFNFYPNPVHNLVYLSSKLYEPLSYVLYNAASGQVVYKTSFRQSGTADISSLAAGIYLYQVKTGNGSVVETGKLTVAK